MNLRKKIDDQTAEVNQVTDKDGLDRSDIADNYWSVIDYTVYIAGKHMNRASDWYDDFVKVPTLWNAVPKINQYKSFMFGMKAVPYVGE